MPGGDPAAWPHVKPIFQAIAAKAPDGSPCCDWVGTEGAGHYVKMVHNGIEYGDMQLIGEAYHLLSRLGGLDADGAARCLRPLEQGAARQLPDRDHPRHLRLPRPGNRQAAGGPDPRRGRPEGHRQVDGRLGHRPGHSADAHRRGGLRPLPVGPEGRARRRRRRCCTAPSRSFTGDREALHRRRRDGPLRQQDHLLRPGLRPDAGDGEGIRLDDQQRGGGADVARRLHHPQRVPGQDQGGVRPQPEPDEPAGRSLLRRRGRAAASRAGAGPSRRAWPTAFRCRR